MSAVSDPDVVFLILCVGMMGVPMLFAGYLIPGAVRLIRERRRPPVISLVLLGLGPAALAGWVVLGILEEQELYLYLGGKLSPFWRRVLCWCFPPLIGVGTILFSARRLRSAATAGWAAALAVALLCIYTVLGLSALADTQITTVVSPPVDGKTHEVLLVERPLLLGGDYTVYERVSPVFVYRLGKYNADDGETPVADGRYTVDRQSDGFTFTGGLTKEKRFSYAP